MYLYIHHLHDNGRGGLEFLNNGGGFDHFFMHKTTFFGQLDRVSIMFLHTDKEGLLTRFLRWKSEYVVTSDDRYRERTILREGLEIICRIG